MNRKERNRIAAAKSRKRKAEHIANLESENEDLKKKNQTLIEENKKLSEKITSLEKEVICLLMPNDYIIK